MILIIIFKVFTQEVISSTATDGSVPCLDPTHPLTGTGLLPGPHPPSHRDRSFAQTPPTLSQGPVPCPDPIHPLTGTGLLPRPHPKGIWSLLSMFAESAVYLQSADLAQPNSCCFQPRNKAGQSLTSPCSQDCTIH